VGQGLEPQARNYALSGYKLSNVYIKQTSLYRRHFLIQSSRMEKPLTGQESDRIELLRRQYLQLLGPDLLAMPGPELLRRPDVQRQLYEKMFHSENLMFVPNNRYQLRVLKELVTRIENIISDPEEDVGFLYSSGCCCLLCILSATNFFVASTELFISSHELISDFLTSRKYPMIS